MLPFETRGEWEARSKYPGMPNPLPLKWVRLAKFDTTSHHDEESKLCKILKSNPPRSTGHNKNHYAYSNIGYWVLGKVLSQNCDKSMNNFGDICQELLFSGNLSDEHAKAIGTTFSKEEPMAMGHVARWSVLGMVAPYLVPSGMIQDQPNKNWLCMAPHYLDGASFGGLVASTEAVGEFMQLILQGKILNPTSLNLLFTPRIPQMTMGLNVRHHGGMPVYHKEGGGA
eukprot:scaffold11372_cov47-Attheya_sp.AAC.1